MNPCVKQGVGQRRFVGGVASLTSSSSEWAREYVRVSACELITTRIEQWPGCISCFVHLYQSSVRIKFTRYDNNISCVSQCTSSTKTHVVHGCIILLICLSVCLLLWLPIPWLVGEAVWIVLYYGLFTVQWQLNQ